VTTEGCAPTSELRPEDSGRTQDDPGPGLETGVGAGAEAGVDDEDVAREALLISMVRQAGAAGEQLRFLAEGGQRRRRRRRRKRPAQTASLPQLPELDGESSDSDRGLSSAGMSSAEECEQEDVELVSPVPRASSGLRRSQSAGVVASKAFSAGAVRLSKAFSRESLHSVEDSLSKNLTAQAGRLARAFSREAHDIGDDRSPKLGVAGKFVRVFTRESLSSSEDRRGGSQSSRTGRMAKALSRESLAASDGGGSRSAGARSGLPLLPRSLVKIARASSPTGIVHKAAKMRILRDLSMASGARCAPMAPGEDDGASRLRGAFSRAKSRSTVSTGSGNSTPTSFPSSHCPSQDGVAHGGPSTSPPSP